MRRSHLIILSLISLSAAGSAQASGFETLLETRLAHTSSINPMPDHVPYTHTVTVDQSGGGDAAPSFTGTFRFNPNAPAGERVELLDGDYTDFPKGFTDGLDRADYNDDPLKTAREFWCMNDPSGFLEVLSLEGTSLISETDDAATLSIDAEGAQALIGLRMSEDDELPGKIKKRLAGEITVSKPDLYLKSSRIWLTKPTTMKVVAKIKDMTFTQTCELAPNGLPYISEKTSVVSGKAMGKSFSSNVKVTTFDLTR